MGDDDVRPMGPGHYGSTPAWPASMIRPSESELARWTELWRSAHAASWMRGERQRAVASLVRLEERCSRRRPSARALVQLADLRRELGLPEED